MQKGGSSILDVILVENRSSKEAEVQVCAADVESTDHDQVWTESRQTRLIKHRRGWKLYGLRKDKLEVQERQQETQ